MPEHLEQWLKRFDLHDVLRDHLRDVLSALPDETRRDFIDDPLFAVCDYQPGAKATVVVPMGVPSRGMSSRSIVFKRTLARRDVGFIRYVIAHELAHAHLRNADADPAEPAEADADALAAAWGFPRPTPV